MADLQIFDGRGIVRRDYTDDEIAALTKEQRADLFKMLSVYQEEVAAENALIDAERALTDTVRAVNKLHEERPKIDAQEVFLRELRATINRPQS